MSINMHVINKELWNILLKKVLLMFERKSLWYLLKYFSKIVFITLLSKGIWGILK